MRFIALVVVFLGLTGWTLAHWPQTQQMPVQPAFTWRRTAAGWERIDRWPTNRMERYQGAPLLLGSFQLGVSLLALLAGHDAEQRRARPRDALSSVLPAQPCKPAPCAAVARGEPRAVS